MVCVCVWKELVTPDDGGIFIITLFKMSGDDFCIT